jgi:hypothetical protein
MTMVLLVSSAEKHMLFGRTEKHMVPLMFILMTSRLCLLVPEMNMTGSFVPCFAKNECVSSSHVSLQM